MKASVLGIVQRFNREERKRILEFASLVVATILLLGLSRLETRLFDLSEHLSENKEFFTSVVYFGLINLNVILILLISFLILRNIVKLVVERRRGVLGSRLRSKLVVTLVFFALLPTALLFYVSSKFIVSSYDKWFSEKVRDTMQQTREAGAMVYRQDQRRLESLARIALQRIDVDRSGNMRFAKLDGFDSEYRLDGVRVMGANGRQLWPNDNAPESVSDVFALGAMERFTREPGLVSMSTVEAEAKRDVVRGIAPIINPATKQAVGAVLVEERFETSIVRSIESILSEFADFKPGVQLIRLSHQILLIMMALLIIFCATWLGFYVAREITEPLQSLAEATREVALGNYNVTLESKKDDETGVLVRSFNQMTKDLWRAREEAEQSQGRLWRTNEELERRRRYMEVVLRNISTGVISLDAQGRISSVNRAAEKLLNIQAAKVTQRPIKEGLGEYLYEHFWRPMLEQTQVQGRSEAQMEIEWEGQPRILLADAARLTDESQRDVGMVVVFDDATHQVQSQRVAAWREVARRIAHEIKNPITPIKLSAQRLLRRYHDRFEGAEKEVFESCIATITAQVDSLRDLVNEFSKFSRLPNIRPRLANINSVIEQVASFYRSSYPDVEIDTSELLNVPETMIDTDQMNRVFVNIVTNSLAAIEESGERGRIAFRSYFLLDANAVRVEVTDNGCGIPTKLKDRVLEPYFSTKKDGTGLGLAIVNQIVSDHGGYVRIADAQPKGTILIIEIPVAPTTLSRS